MQRYRSLIGITRHLSSQYLQMENLEIRWNLLRKFMKGLESRQTLVTFGRYDI